MMIKEFCTLWGRRDRLERKGQHCECCIYVLLFKGWRWSCCTKGHIRL